MTGWLQRSVAFSMALALIVPVPEPLRAQSQVSPPAAPTPTSQQPGGFVMKPQSL